MLFAVEIPLQKAPLIDLALYDLMGKVSSQPVCRLLGGKLASAVETSKAVGLGSKRICGTETIVPTDHAG
jgi:L-alanine-DL-glutamate epimerase-like enolase superfamily enzyme